MNELGADDVFHGPERDFDRSGLGHGGKRPLSARLFALALRALELGKSMKEEARAEQRGGLVPSCLCRPRRQREPERNHHDAVSDALHSRALCVRSLAMTSCAGVQVTIRQGVTNAVL